MLHCKSRSLQQQSAAYYAILVNNIQIVVDQKWHDMQHSGVGGSTICEATRSCDRMQEQETTTVTSRLVNEAA